MPRGKKLALTFLFSNVVFQIFPVNCFSSRTMLQEEIVYIISIISTPCSQMRQFNAAQSEKLAYDSMQGIL